MVRSDCQYTTDYAEYMTGELVGDFELGANVRNPGTLCLRGNEYPISELLTSQFNVFRTVRAVFYERGAR
jgi:hypothetical protein